MFKKKGFTLIEVLIFSTLISFIFITLAYLVNITLLNNKIGEHKILAAHYSEELREWLRGQKEADWYVFFNKSSAGGTGYCFAATPISDWTAACGDLECGGCGYSMGVLPNTTFKRYVKLTKNTNPDWVKAEIIVEWKEGSNTFKVASNTIFSSTAETIASLPGITITPTIVPTSIPPTSTPTPTTPACFANGTNCSSDAQCCSNYCYVDADRDRYAPSSGTPKCQTNSQLAGTDCYDSNSNVHPGQTIYYTSQRGDGSYDYDCDTIELKRIDSCYTCDNYTLFGACTRGCGGSKYLLKANTAYNCGTVNDIYFCAVRTRDNVCTVSAGGYACGQDTTSCDFCAGQHYGISSVYRQYQMTTQCSCR